MGLPVLNLPDLGKGIIPDALGGDMAPGYWTSCVNFRFRNGYAIKWEGAAQIANGGSTTVPYRFVMPYATPTPSGSSLTTNYMIGAGVARVFSNDGSAESEITRYTEGVTISSITRVGTTATLTTGSNHNRSNGDTVTIWGASPSQYNGTYVITVTSPTTWTYVMASDPGASASPVGYYSYNVAVNFTGATTDQWTGGVLGGIAYLNNPVDGLYWWAGSGRLRKVPDSYKAYSSRPFKSFMIQMGPTINGTAYPWNVAWSGVTEPGQVAGPFTAAATNSAGDQPLADTPGAAIDGLQLGDVFAVYKQDSIYTMQHVPGSIEVFNIQRIPGGDGIFARNCVVDTPVGHVFFSQKRDVRIFDGRQTRSIANARVRNFISGIMNKSKDHCVFVCSNPVQSEVWICFAQTGQSTTEEAATVAYVWNWESDAWGQFQFQNVNYPLVTHAASGTWPSAMSTGLVGEDLLLATHDNKVGVSVESGNGQYFGNTLPSLLYRYGVKLTPEFSAATMLRSRWHIAPVAGQTVTVYHGAGLKFDVPPTFPTDFVSATYTVGTDEWANARSPSGKWQAIYLVFNDTRVQAVRSGAIEYTVDGDR